MACSSMLMQTVRPCTACPDASSRDGADSALMLDPSQQAPSSTKGPCDPDPRPRQPVPVAGFRSITNHFRRHRTIRTAGTRRGGSQRTDSALPYVTTVDAGLEFRSRGRPRFLQFCTMWPTPLSYLSPGRFQRPSQPHLLVSPPCRSIPQPLADDPLATVPDSLSRFTTPTSALGSPCFAT